MKRLVIIVGLSILLLTGFIAFCISEGSKAPQKSLSNFSRIVENGKLDELRLRIY